MTFDGIVCARVQPENTPPISGSVKERCKVCRELVWVSKTTRATVPRAPAWCIQCVLELTRKLQRSGSA